MFFYCFEAHYFGKNFTDEQLYYELIIYLTKKHLCRVLVEMKDKSLLSYAVSRAALIKVDTVPIRQKFQNLRDASVLVIALHLNF